MFAAIFFSMDYGIEDEESGSHYSLLHEKVIGWGQIQSILEEFRYVLTEVLHVFQDFAGTRVNYLQNDMDLK
jgi:hypothetical protein